MRRAARTKNGSNLTRPNATTYAEVLNPESQNLAPTIALSVPRKMIWKVLDATQPSALRETELSDFRWLESRRESRFSGQIYTAKSMGAGQPPTCFGPSEVT